MAYTIIEKPYGTLVYPSTIRRLLVRSFYYLNPVITITHLPIYPFTHCSKFHASPAAGLFLILTAM
ncbi:MAG: hypothetical protein ORN57_02500 [Alphaproteobacteria bacterium]|nr:hypothetical protein [Alphaproteobacteria bacterium]